MIYRAPLPFTEALESNAARVLLPTDFRTRLLSTLDPELRRRAVFTASGTNAQHVGEIQDVAQEILEGRLNRAEGRARLRELVDGLGYQPVPGEEGSLTDLSSERRINLQIDTNVQQMQELGRAIQQDQPAIRDEFPAWELVRFSSPENPEAMRDWAARWVKAGGEFYGDGRMIARKDSQVWERLGDPDLFSDGLGNNYPPYAFNSGVGRRAVDRDEAVSLGVIGEDDEVASLPPTANGGLKLAVALSTDSLAQAMVEDLASKGVEARVVDGVLRFIGGTAP